MPALAWFELCQVCRAASVGLIEGMQNQDVVKTVVRSKFVFNGGRPAMSDSANLGWPSARVGDVDRNVIGINCKAGWRPRR